jgi:hypothetical protein
VTRGGAAGYPAPREVTVTPCPHCSLHVRTRDAACVHCGGALPSTAGSLLRSTATAALLGLAVACTGDGDKDSDTHSGSTDAQPLYGVTTTDYVDADTDADADSDTDADSDSDADSDTDADTDTDAHTGLATGGSGSTGATGHTGSAHTGSKHTGSTTDTGIIQPLYGVTPTY